MNRLKIYKTSCFLCGTSISQIFLGNYSFNIKFPLVLIFIVILLILLQLIKFETLRLAELEIITINKITIKVMKAFTIAYNNFFYFLSHELYSNFLNYTKNFDFVNETLNSDKTKIEKLNLLNGLLFIPTFTQFKTTDVKICEDILDKQINQLKYIIENIDSINLILNNTDMKKEDVVFNILLLIYKNYFKNEELSATLIPTNRMEELALLSFKFGIFGDIKNGWKIYKIKYSNENNDKDTENMVIVKYYDSHPTYFDISMNFNHKEQIFFSSVELEQFLTTNIENEKQKLL